MSAECGKKRRNGEEEKRSFGYASRKEKVERQRNGETARTVNDRYKKCKLCKYEYIFSVACALAFPTRRREKSN